MPLFNNKINFPLSDLAALGHLSQGERQGGSHGTLKERGKGGCEAVPVNYLMRSDLSAPLSFLGGGAALYLDKATNFWYNI